MFHGESDIILHGESDGSEQKTKISFITEQIRYYNIAVNFPIADFCNLF